MQRKWYRSVLEKDIDAVNGTILSHLITRSILTMYWQVSRGRRKARRAS